MRTGYQPGSPTSVVTSRSTATISIKMNSLSAKTAFQMITHDQAIYNSNRSINCSLRYPRRNIQIKRLELGTWPQTIQMTIQTSHVTLKRIYLPFHAPILDRLHASLQGPFQEWLKNRLIWRLRVGRRALSQLSYTRKVVKYLVFLRRPKTLKACQLTKTSVVR